MSPLIGNLLKGDEEDIEDPIEETPLMRAHFVERHMVHTELSWEQATQKMSDIFPRDARLERPADWYRRLIGTHWPQQVPPGNGPFYLPEWTFPEDKWAEYHEQLEEAGFEEAIAHVVMLPHNNEYLAAIMRAAQEHPWTANPITYRGYIYPELKKLRDRELRSYNVERGTI